ALRPAALVPALCALALAACAGCASHGGAHHGMRATGADGVAIDLPGPSRTEVGTEGGEIPVPYGAPAGTADGGDIPVPYTSLDVDDEDGDFAFVVVTDRTGEHRDHVFRDAMPKVNLLRPAFVISVGDLIEGYTEDRGELGAEWDEFEGFTSTLRMPFFYVPGNHDMSNDVMAHVWRERFGPSFYHFRYKGALFLALNSELFSMVSKPGHSVGGPDTQAAQMAYVERVLAENRDARWTFVFVHQPFWDSPRIHPDWLRVEELLGDRDYTVFAGHIHAYTLHRRHDRNYVTLATTGGGSPMRGLLHGEFDHVVQVSVRGDGPSIANLDVEGIQPVDVRDDALRASVQRVEGAVRAQPMRFAGERFRGGEVEFQLHNDGDAPLAYEGVFEESRDLAASTPRVAGTVPPNSVVPVRVPLVAKRPVAYESLAPARMRWEISTAGPRGEDVRVDVRSSIAPEREFACGGGAQIDVDGDLGEWASLPFSNWTPAVVERPRFFGGPKDAAVRFGVRCDADYVYLGFDVADDSIVASPDRVAREQDGLSISIDARPDPARSAGGQGFFAALADGSLSKVIMLGAGPEPSPTPDPIFSVFLPKPPEGVRTATRRTDTGYAAELAIPTSALDAMGGGHFDAFRLDVSLNDFDEGEPGHATLWWKPSRFGEQAIPGSGTFERK
ncbi:MAG: metallophosphoesterase, partial [Myxococcales bacterium]|nr:metallophosphoesterase [Myxococcales bacterium]